MDIQLLFSGFLNTHLADTPPLLLGLSGGPDSMALFHLLMEKRYPFEVAHIDHGWRMESKKEANYLAKLCEKTQVPFHLKHLEPTQEAKNLEDLGRRERLTFFKQIIHERSLQGILLAHHADDHAETVLKRLFEGASLPKLKGLVPKTEVEGMTIYRPFLKIKKQQILNWLKENDFFYFIDATNEDPRFLRSRLRNDLIPTLSSQFGKEISSNLCKLGEAAAELDLFLNELAAPYLERICVNADSMTLDFSMEQPKSFFIWKVVLRYFFEHAGISLTSSLVESILSHLYKGSCHKKLKIGTQIVEIHKKQIKLKKCEI